MGREDALQIDDQLRSLSFFRKLHPPELAEISRRAVLVEVGRGELLALEGDPCTAVFFCVSGHLRAVKTSPRGREQVVEDIMPGHAFYVVPALDGGLLPATTRAVKKSAVVSFERDEFLRILAQYPPVSQIVLAEFARRLRKLNALVEDLALYSVPERLARLLLDYAQTPGRHRTTQRELATQIGTVREVVARSLSGFEKRGWVRLGRGTIEILNAEALGRIALGDDV